MTHRERLQDSEKVKDAWRAVFDSFSDRLRYCGVEADVFAKSFGMEAPALDALCSAVAEAVSVPPEAAREGAVAEGTLSVNADAIEVRKRFDVLMERMDEFYPEQGMWDAQVVACYLVQEARFHVDVLRALCGEAAQCTFEVDSDAARELTVRLNQAWCGEDPVGAASQGEAERGPLAWMFTHSVFTEPTIITDPDAAERLRARLNVDWTETPLYARSEIGRASCRARVYITVVGV